LPSQLFVEGLDAVDRSPVLDLKPRVREFGPRGTVTQPEWMSELMQGYWHLPSNPSAEFFPSPAAG